MRVHVIYNNVISLVNAWEYFYKDYNYFDYKFTGYLFYRVNAKYVEY